MTTYTVPTKAAALDVAFGPEKAVYERLLFGSNSTDGITKGDFYDMRGYPVPYTPDEVTDLTLTLPNGSEIVGQNLQIEIIRDDPKVLPAHEIVMFSPSSEVTNFGVRLDQGLNFIRVMNAAGDAISTFSLSATRFATILYAVAVDIYAKIWEPIDSTSKEIFDTHTGLFANLISFTDLLPDASSRHLLSTYLAMRAMVAKVGTEEGLTALTQAILDQTPIARKIEANNWGAEWLRPVPPTTVAQVGRELHLWSYDAVASRIIQFGRLCKNTGRAVTQDKFGAEVDGKQYDWKRYLDASKRAPKTSTKKRFDGHVVDVKTSVNLAFPWNDGKRTLVQFPGLWDNKIPYFDQSIQFDQGALFDSSDTTGPLGFKGWVGVPVLPPAPFGEARSEGSSNMSVLIATDIIAELQNNLDARGIQTKTTTEWGSDSFSFSGSITASNWSASSHTAVAADPLVDYVAAIDVRLAESSAATHQHTLPLLTVGQWKSVLNGGSVTVQANIENGHTHTVTISLDNLIPRVAIGDNHGHLTTIAIPVGLGV